MTKPVMTSVRYRLRVGRTLDICGPLALLAAQIPAAVTTGTSVLVTDNQGRTYSVNRRNGDYRVTQVGQIDLFDQQQTPPRWPDRLTGLINQGAQTNDYQDSNQSLSAQD